MSLLPNTTYYYRVKAVSSQGESEYSEPASVTTLSTNDSLLVPIPVSNPVVAFVQIFDSSIELSLFESDSLEQVLEYKITVSTVSDFSTLKYDKLVYSIETDTVLDFHRKLLIVGLVENTVYYVKIQAVNSISSSAEVSLTYTTLKSFPAPVITGTSNLTSITARINWTPVIDATNYFIDVDNNSDFSSLVVSNQPSTGQLFFDIPTLIENTVYYVRVRSFKTGTTSNNSQVFSFKTLDNTETLPGFNSELFIPSIRAISNKTNVSFRVEWNHVENSTGYRIDISTSSSFSTFIVEDLSVSGLFYDAVSLSNNTTYYVRVRSVNSLAVSDNVNVTVNTLLFNPALTVPGILTADSVYTNSAILRWIKRTYADGYQIDISNVSNFSSVLFSIFVKDVDSILVDSLNANTTYFYRVRATNSVNISSYSSTGSFTTTANLPAIALNNVTELTHTSARLNWNTFNVYSKYFLTLYKKYTNSVVYIDEYFSDKDLGFTGTYAIELFLEPESEYEYFITGVTLNGASRLSNVGTFTTMPDKPLIRLSPVTGHLEWFGKLNYIQVASDNEFKNCFPGYVKYQVPEEVTSIYIPFKTRYFIRGFYSLNNSRSPYSNIIQYSNILPSVTVENITNTSAVVKWNFTEAEFYRLKLFINNSGSFIPVLDSNVGKTTTFKYNSLIANSQYMLSFQSYIDNKYINNLPVYFSTNSYNFDLTSLALDIGLTVPVIQVEKRTFNSFEVKETGQLYSKYIVQISNHPTFLSNFNQHYEVVSKAEVLGLVTNQNYYIRVAGISGTTRTSFVTLNTSTLSAPVIPSATNIPVLGSPVYLDDNTAKIAWSSVLNASGYRIEISKNSSFSVLDYSVTTKYFENYAVISGLSFGVNYYCRIYAYSGNNNSNYSASILIRTS